jgi:hypothetical protein
MTAIEQKAREVALIMNRDQFVPRVVAFDPILVMTIAQILYQLVKMYQSCGASEETAVKRAMDPGVIGRWRLSNIIKAKLKGTGNEHQYHHIKKAIEQSNKTLTVHDMSMFYSEAKS